jgi:hypothetical protein
MTRLTVCWTPPPTAPDGPVLSFLRPADEEALARRCPGAFLRAREMRPADRARARLDYLGVSARIGAVRAGDRTLREDCSDGAVSAWWFHPTSFKDCESDPAFGRLLALRAVLRALEDSGADELETWGAPPELAEVLRGRAPVIERASPWRTREGFWWLRGLASRAFGLGQALLDLLACAPFRPAGAPSKRPALLGYWDWSVREQNGGLTDRYFKALPEELAKLGAAPLRLCWLDVSGDPARPSRGRLAAVRAAAAHGVVLLQSFLDPGDALEASLDLKPLCAYLRRRDDPDFRAAFAADGLDLFPLFEERLLRGFLDGGLPRCALILEATRRACAALEPSVCVHFLEHFPHARAAFAGARAAATRTAAVQHASFCREKTFYFLDPALEFRGEPDGRPAPVPDLVFAMGRLSAGYFRDCGYPAERVVESGSTRYDHVRPPSPARTRSGAGVRVLLAPALDLDVEASLLEAAAAAGEGLPGVEIRLRDHPFAPLSRRPEYAAVKERVALSAGRLEDDLAWADLVLFSYSTVAEEAVLQGVPAWQWRPVSYDASALAEAADIPRFASVAALRGALAGFKPGDGLPDDAARAKLVTDLFTKADGGAAGRVANSLYSSS